MFPHFWYAAKTMVRLLLASTVLVSLALGASLPASARAQGETTYEMRIRRALDAASSDRSGAMSAFREAISQDPTRPDAYCYVAELHRLAGDLTSALDNFQTCMTVARTARSTSFAARGAHGVALTFERMGAEHRADARNAWQAYERLTEDPLVFPEIGREREAAIDAVVALAERAAAVRQRIADREAAAAASGGSSSGSGAGSGSRSR